MCTQMYMYSVSVSCKVNGFVLSRINVQEVFKKIRGINVQEVFKKIRGTAVCTVHGKARNDSCDLEKRDKANKNVGA